MNTNKFLQQMQIIFYAIMSGHIIFACLVVFVIPSDASFTPGDLMLSIDMALVLLLLFYAFYFYRQRTAAIAAKYIADDEKLGEWRATAITRWALIDFVCFAQIAFLFISGNNLFLYAYVVGALAMMYTKPAPATVQSELRLKSNT